MNPVLYTKLCAKSIKAEEGFEVQSSRFKVKNGKYGTYGTYGSHEEHVLASL
jgi:hypothetical protein